MSETPSILLSPEDRASGNHPPMQAFVLLANVDAPTRKELASRLRHLAHRIEHEGFEGRSICGSGGGGGHIVELFTNPGMTPDRYFEELNAYLERQRATEPPHECSGFAAPQQEKP